MFTLPEPLLRELDSYARAVNEGNKSGFVSDAIAQRITWLRKARHTIKMRDSYHQSAKDNLRITKEWEELDDQLWRKLDALEQEENE